MTIFLLFLNIYIIFFGIFFLFTYMSGEGRSVKENGAFRMAYRLVSPHPLVAPSSIRDKSYGSNVGILKLGQLYYDLMTRPTFTQASVAVDDPPTIFIWFIYLVMFHAMSPIKKIKF